MSLNILIIDDTETHASLVARVVRKQGNEAVVAQSAEEGLTKFEEQDFDLVITDIFMEGMGGIAGIKKIRALHSHVKIIAMSAGYSEMTAEEALKTAQEVGADVVLPKPFALAELRDVVSKLLES